MSTFRKVFITGATGSLGKSVVQKFKSEKFTVITSSLSPSSESDLHLICDLADSTQVQELCRKISELKIDILVNNAGVNIVQPINEIQKSQLESAFQINLIAPFLLTQAVLPYMRENRWGRIINIGSILGQITRPGRSVYSTTKAGLVGFTRAVATEVAKEGITSNIIAPGYLESKLTRRNLSESGMKAILERIPVGRLGNTMEVANLIRYLSSDEASFITGQVFFIDGGQLAT